MGPRRKLWLARRKGGDKRGKRASVLVFMENLREARYSNLELASLINFGDSGA